MSAPALSLVRRTDIIPGRTEKIWQVLAEDRDALLDLFFQTWGIPRSDRFPGANCVSIERKDFLQLQMRVYWACEKTDGVRYAMFCTRYKDKNICALVNRNLEIFLLGINIPRTMYAGTILDGELVMNKTTKIVYFLVFDAVCVAGVSVRDATFTVRMKSAVDVITSAKQLPTDSVHVQGKNFFPLNTFGQFSEYLEDIKKHFDVDGLVFTPEDLPVMTHRHRQMFKWKTHHTIDFLVDGDAKDGFFLHVYDSLNKKMRKASRLIDRNGLDLKAGDVVECDLPDGGTTWKPLFVRGDKSHPNDLETFKRTMINMRENIRMEEFSKIVKPT